MINLQKNDKKFREKRYIPLNGGFHTVLETHKLCGKMFGPAHLREIRIQWRPTVPRLDWMMCPRDPNQVEDELKIYCLAMICSAVYNLLQHHDESGQDDSVDDVSSMVCI